MESRVELFARIRRDARVEELSIRELARRHGVGRPTVRQALLQAEPPAAEAAGPCGATVGAVQGGDRRDAG